MPLANFLELQDEIVSFARKQGDVKFMQRVPTFIALAEDVVMTGTSGIAPLRVREMEASAAITLTNGVGPLPDDYLEFKQINDGSNPPRILEPVDTWWGGSQYPSTAAGVASYFSISGTTITTYSKSSSNLTMVYYQKIPALTQENPTNWLLTKAPSVYLFGALTQATAFMQADERVPLWGTQFAGAIEGLRSSDGMSKYARAVSRPRGPTP